MSDKPSNLQRLDQELNALSEQTRRLESIGELMTLLRGHANDQENLALRLDLLEQSSSRYLHEAEALRQNLERTATGTADTARVTHERVQATKEQLSELKVDLNQRLGELRADVREVLVTKLDANAAEVLKQVTGQLATASAEQAERYQVLKTWVLVVAGLLFALLAAGAYVAFKSYALWAPAG